MTDQIERVRRCNEISERAVRVIVVAAEKCVQCGRDVYASDGVTYTGLLMHVTCVEAYIGLVTAQRDFALQQMQQPQWTSWGASGGTIFKWSLSAASTPYTDYTVAASTGTVTVQSWPAAPTLVVPDRILLGTLPVTTSYTGMLTGVTKSDSGP